MPDNNVNIELTVQNLKKNGYDVICLDKKDEVLKAVSGFLRDGATVACGGSETLHDCKIVEFISGKRFNYIDTWSNDLTEVEKLIRYRQVHSADIYLSGTNAITEDGVLYNVDGRSNRIINIAFGPEKVVIVAGVNKIVKSLEKAVYRVKTIAAPKNCVRLSKETYCAKNGKCVSLLDEEKGKLMEEGCSGKDRICRNYLISGPQLFKGRITVILVNENLGY